MSVNLVKGDKISLSKETNLNSIRLGLGWRTHSDLDSIAYLTDEAGVILETIYFGNKKSKGIKHNGDDLVGGKKGDCETIDITLNGLPSWCTRIQFCVNIYSNIGCIIGFTPLVSFNSIKEAFVRLVNRDNDEELCRYNLTEDGKGFDAFHFADLYKDSKGEWHFEAIGQGMRGNISVLRRKLSR